MGVRGAIRSPSVWLVAVAALVGLWLVFVMPVDWLIVNVVADDCFYYLTIARNIAWGNGSTFDGVIQTNGYHPLFMLLLIPLAWVTGGAEVLCFRLALALLVVFYLTTGALISWWARWRRMDRGAVALAVVLWFANPWILVTTLRGVESAVAACWWVIVALAYERYRDARQWNTAFGLGVAIGFAVLARTDGLMLLAGVLGYEVLHVLSRRRPLLAWLPVWGCMVGAALIVTLPWWIWNLVQFGTLLQVSGQAVYHMGHGFSTPTFSDWIVGMRRTLRGCGILVLVMGMMPFLLLALALHAGHGRTLRQRISPLVLAMSDLGWMGLAVAGLVVWYAGWQQYLQQWYFMPILLFLTLLVVYAWDLTGRELTAVQAKRLRLMSFATVVVVAFLTVTLIANGPGFGYPDQINGYRLAQWLRTETTPDDIVGAWNAGILGYFSGRRVVNLDGVVNSDVLAYMVTRGSGDLSVVIEYAQSIGVDYLMDCGAVLPAEVPEGVTALVDVMYPLEGVPLVYRLRGPSQQ